MVPAGDPEGDKARFLKVEPLLSMLHARDINLRLENTKLLCDAPAGAMTPDLMREIERNKDDIVKFLTARAGRDVPIRRSGPDGPDGLPLSFQQESLWFLAQLDPESAAYNISVKITVATRIDGAILQRSLDEILRRHEVLRTHFRIIRGSPAQIIGPPTSFPMTVIDLSTEADGVRLAKAEEWCSSEAARPFRIDQDLLLRAALLRLAPEQHMLLLVVHHIVADAASVDIILSDLRSIYEAFSSGSAASSPEPAFQYADFALWQRQRLSADTAERQLAYWMRQMANAPPLLEMPTDWRRDPERLPKGSTAAVVISKTLTAKVNALCRSEGASLFMGLLTGFQILLYRCSGQSEVVVGAAISGRHLAELEGVVGLFINTLPLRIDLAGNPSFRIALSRAREMVLDAQENQDIPFETLVRELRPSRVVGRNPLFQAFFSFRNRAGEGSLADANSELVANEGAKFDFSLYVDEFADGAKVEMEYRSDLYSHDRARSLLKGLMQLLEEAAIAPETGIDDLPLMDAGEARRALDQWNATEVAFDLTRSVDEWIFEAASLHPDIEAVRYGGEKLTYRQLCERADEAAVRLRAVGVKPDDVVGLFFERSLDLVVGLLAILRAGAAFLPLDPNYPRERLAYILNDARAAAILTRRRSAAAISGVAAPLLCLDDPPVEEQETAIGSRSASRRRLTDLAYVIYTSGSTGAPKGVEVSHSSLVNFLFAMRQRFGVANKDVMLAVTTISFDIAMLELLLPLVSGARVVIASREQAASGAELVRLLRTANVSLMQATPTTWRLLLAAGWPGSPNLQAMCGGESWTEDLAEALSARCHSLWNMYGPTESTIWSAVRQIKPGEQVLIGGPIANTQFYVLEPSGKLAPPDVPGELYIGGAGLARGYRGRPDLTAERFIPNPFGRDEHDRLYRTGDRVRRLPSGDIQFLGRLDDQVKIRGFRIELEEVAIALRSHSDVENAVVVVHNDDTGEKSLVAYCLRSPDGRPGPDDLRTFLKAKLPNHMVPAAFEFLERYPVTPSGKIDRKTLEARTPILADADRSSVTPRTVTEKIIARTWAKFLKLSAIGISDDFFDLGAHSMMVVKVVDELNSSAGFQVSVVEVFKNPTVEKLAAIVEQQRHVDRRKPAVIPLRQVGLGVPIYFINAGPAELALARSLAADHPVFGIEVPWPLEWRRAVEQNRKQQYPKLDEIVRVFVDLLHSHLGDGSCIVAGYSFAGLLAFEVARGLLDKQGRVDAVIVIDKWLRYPSIFGALWRNLRDCWAEPTGEAAAQSVKRRLLRSGMIAVWSLSAVVKHRRSFQWLRPNEMTSFSDELGAPLRWALVESAYKELERNIQLEPLDCRGIVVGSEFLDRHRALRATDEYHGWQALFKKGVTALIVSGDHFSMVREHSAELAQMIGRAADRHNKDVSDVRYS